jgi:hypothetical protein
MCSPWKRTFALAPMAFLTMFSPRGFDLNFKKNLICKKNQSSGQKHVWEVQRWHLRVHNLTLAIFFAILTIFKP